jgi:putative phosphoribosyl transferase
MTTITQSPPAHSVVVRAGRVELDGDLRLPPSAQGLVIFAHGSGGSRRSSRNQFVARALNHAGLATLLVDLLTPSEAAAEAHGAHLRFNIPLISERLLGAVDWAAAESELLGNLPVGCLGALTGAAAALVVAATRPKTVRAVVSRGGRPDLAGAALSRVKAPTRLIVGGHDYEVIGLNREAFVQLRTVRNLTIIPGATLLFEEPGALEAVATLAVEWFVRYVK